MEEPPLPGNIGTAVILAALILLSAFFSATEMAFSSLNRIRLKNLAENGSKRARLALSLHGAYDILLSTILVGNNIANLTAAAVSTVFFVKAFPDIGATLSTVVITVAVLIFGEITPKSLAKESPEKFALFAAPMLRVMIAILMPVNYLFAQWKKLLSAVFKLSDDHAMTEEELLTVVDEAEQDGAINEEDKQLINSVIEFNDLRAEDILTPRVDIAGISKNASMDEITELFLSTGYSRLPVYDGSLDDITGIVHIRDFLDLVLNNNKPIDEIIAPVVFVTPSIRISELLKLLQKKKSHMAVVTDEYGGTSGIVTMEDILEELVGEIWDEHDEVIEEFVRLDDNTYKIVCTADIDKMFDYFNVTGETDSSTVSGWIMDMLGKIPEAGDSFVYDNLQVTVHKTDHRRVLECIINELDDKDIN